MLHIAFHNHKIFIRERHFVHVLCYFSLEDAWSGIIFSCRNASYRFPLYICIYHPTINYDSSIFFLGNLHIFLRILEAISECYFSLSREFQFQISQNLLNSNLKLPLPARTKPETLSITQVSGQMLQLSSNEFLI